jgi:hypothetical protein
VDTATDSLLGDLRERADGGYDGWCFDPSRPTERLIVEIFVNDVPAAAMVAGLFRRDLLALGGDGRHGFVLALPANVPGAEGECLISARERRTDRVFGRMLRRFPARVPAAEERVAALEARVAALRSSVEDVGARLGAAPGQAARLRAAFGELAERLAPAPASGHKPSVAAPRLALLLPGGAAQAAALRPALGETAADVLPVGREERLDAALARAAAESRASMLVLFGDAAAPSAAALLALSRALAEADPAVALGPAALHLAVRRGLPAFGREVMLPARLGLRVACARDAWASLAWPALPEDAGEAALALGRRARLLGLAVLGVAEPWVAS